MGTSLLCMVDSSCRSPCKCFEVCPNGGFLNVVCIMSSSIIKVRIPETSGWKLAIRYTDTTTDTDTEMNTDVTLRIIRNWRRPHLRARIRIHNLVSRVPESYKCSRILTRVLTRILSGCGCLCLLWVNWLAVVVCGCPRLLGVNCFLVVACGCLRRFGVNWLAVLSCGCLRLFGVNWLPVLAWGCLRLLGFTGCLYLPVHASSQRCWAQASRPCLLSRSLTSNRLLLRSIDGCQGKQKEET